MLDNNLSASELLTAFIDGELDASDTQILFFQLANDAELQNEMQDLIAIRTGFSNSSVIPPPDLRNSILKSTVYQNGFAGRFALIPAFLGKYGFKISAAIASFILISLFSFWLVDYNTDSEAELVHNNTANSDVSLLNNDVTNELMSDNNQEIPSNIKNSDENINSNVNTNTKDYNPANNSSGNYSIIDNNSDYNNEEITDESGQIKNIDFAEKTDFSVMPPQKSVDRKDYINFYNLSSKFNKFLEHISINLNKQSLISYPNPQISGENKPLLNDFSLNINYNINRSHFLGVEFGKEYFPMQFKGTEIIKNREVEYEYPQSFSALWAGISYTYNFDNLFTKRLIPYSKITVGGTSLGPVTKLSFGTNYFLNDNIGIYAGVKYGALFYSYQNSIFVTSKYGIDYGLMIRL